MATLVEFRAQNPDYNDMPDVALADALHSKFYADIPKPQFYKQLGLVGADIPEASNVTTLPPKPPSLQDKILGAAEVPLTLGSGLIAGMVSPLAGVYGTLTSGKYGTQEGIKAGEKTASNLAQALTYQPRTETAQNTLQSLAGAISGVPPVIGVGNTGMALLPEAISQTRRAVAPAVASTQQRMAALLQPKQMAMMGGGAASTDEALLRQQRAMSQNIPLTKGEQLQSFPVQQFESEVVKENPELAKSLIQFKEGQKKAILSRFEQLSEQTGAEYADPTAYRKIGSLVDSALVKEFDAKKLKVDKAYQAARDAGETKQVVSTAPLEQWLDTNAGKAISVPEINSIKADLIALKKAKNGQVTIDDLEELYKSAGQLGKPGDPSGLFMKQVKGVINEITDGAGGDLYRTARAQRAELGNQFENTYRVAKLLGTRGGYADRAVALDDVFSHVVLDGSLEEMRTVTKLLKKGGADGQQAYAELQGQTVQYLKDQLTKNASGQLSFAKLKAAVDTLDREDKLTYMFGKQGRDALIDLRDTVQDALVKPAGSVNYSNTGSVVLRGLDKLAAVRFPLAKSAADIVKNRELTQKVEESTKYNALADALKGKK
jgi:hypothetical protein